MDFYITHGTYGSLNRNPGTRSGILTSSGTFFSKVNQGVELLDIQVVILERRSGLLERQVEILERRLRHFEQSSLCINLIFVQVIC